MIRFSIRNKILISFLIVTLVIITIMLGYMHSGFRNVLYENATQDNVLVEERDRFNQLIKKIGMCGEYIATNKFIAEIALTDEKDELKLNNKIQAFIQELKQMYELLIDLKLGEYNVNFFVNENLPISNRLSDGILSAIDNAQTNVYCARKVKNEEWFKKTMENNGDLYVFYDRETSRVSFAKEVGFALGNGENQDWLGVNVITIDLVVLRLQMENRANIDGTNFAIVMNDGTIITKSPDAPGDDYIKNVIEQEDAKLHKTTIIENENVLINEVITDTGIHILSFVEMDTALSDIVESKRILVFTMLSGTILLIVVFVFLSKVLSDPLKKLAKQLKNIKGKDIKPLTISNVKNDEVGDLYSAINGLIVQVNELMGEVEEGLKREKKLEFLTYQMRINPHFLYNTLDSIFWKAVTSHQREIADMTNALSKIFEYSIRGNEQTALLKEEIDMLSCYIELQKKRYGGGIHFSYDLDHASEVSIPKCLLQPLVENAVIHGFSEGSELSVTIVAEKTEDELTIKVSDNGKGKCADKLNEYLLGSVDVLSGGEVGVANVSKRIKFVYGEESSLYYINNTGGGMTAVINIRN